MNTLATLPFTWGKIELSETVTLNSVPHVTRRAIGEWLEYAEPKNAIAKILARNSHIELHSTEVNLSTLDGKNRQVSVYHPIGFLLMVMESGQPKAQHMKVAVAEFVWHFAGNQGLRGRDQIQLRNQRLKILTMLDKSPTPFVRDSLIDDLRDVSFILGIEVQDTNALSAPKDSTPDLFSASTDR